MFVRQDIFVYKNPMLQTMAFVQDNGSRRNKLISVEADEIDRMLTEVKLSELERYVKSLLMVLHGTMANKTFDVLD